MQTSKERDALTAYMRQRGLVSGELTTPEERAVIALTATPNDVQKMMTMDQLEAVVKSVADAIRAAERDVRLATH